MSGIMSMLLGAVSSVAVAVDEFFNRVTLLLPGNGTNGAQNNTFLDSSSNNFTITRNGNTTQGTFSPFSQTGWSAYLSGVYGSSTFTSRALFNGNSTIELWVYPNALSGQQTFVRGGGLNFGTNGAKLRIDDGVNAGSVFESTGNLTANTWNHVAVVRSSNTFTFFINGNSDSSNASISSFYTSNATDLNTGAFNSGGSNPFVGYLSNIRVSNTARTISLPTSAYSSDANTVWLIFQSNRFVDNSSNAYALSFVGTPSVQAFSPFAPTAAYSAATVGGSGYFDGTTDYLQTPATGQFAPTGNWTISLWFYPTALISTQDLIGNFTANTSADWTWVINSNGSIDFYLAGSSTITMSAPSGTIKLNQWHFISVSRSSNTVTAYVNGSQVATASYSTTLGSASKAQFVGSRFGSFACTGYISDVRMVDGQAVTSVPTAPTTTTTGSVTASNTKLLLNFTNAGITDATAKNVLETLGNAQISTTQSKFGGSSMYFDGNGDYLSLPARPLLNVSGNRQFTVECWIYTSSTARQNVCIDTASSQYWDLCIDNLKVNFRYNNAGVSITSSASITSGAWNHIAVCWTGSAMRIFINGTMDSANSATSMTAHADAIMILGYSNYAPDPQWMNGYIDDFRITNGLARYTGNFTTPTTAFPLQ